MKRLSNVRATDRLRRSRNAIRPCHSLMTSRLFFYIQIAIQKPTYSITISFVFILIFSLLLLPTITEKSFLIRRTKKMQYRRLLIWKCDRDEGLHKCSLFKNRNSFAKAPKDFLYHVLMLFGLNFLIHYFITDLVPF